MGRVGSVAQNIIKICNLYLLFNRPANNLNARVNSGFSIYYAVSLLHSWLATESQYKTSVITPAYRTPTIVLKRMAKRIFSLVHVARRVSCISVSYAQSERDSSSVGPCLLVLDQNC